MREESTQARVWGLPPGMEWPLGLVGVFVLVMAVNGVFIYYATTTWNGVVTTDHYQKGIEYNQVLESQARQQALGWQGQVTADLTAGQAGELRFELWDRAGQPIRGAEVAVELFRPVQEGHDQRLTLAEAAPGRYQGVVQLLWAGLWDVKISVKSGGEPFRLTKRINVAGR